MDRLKSCINPNDLIAKCYSTKIIGSDEFEEAEDAPSRPKKASVLLRAVAKSIEKDSAVFNKFLIVLGSEPTNRSLVEELDAALMEKKLAQAPPPPVFPQKLAQAPPLP
ncbi:hypothetical protein EMCRGX_G001845 [Ephydatia muelleri]